MGGNEHYLSKATYKSLFLQLFRTMSDADTDNFLIMTCLTFLEKLSYPTHFHSSTFSPYSINVR